MANPLWKHPGILEGRLDPDNTTYPLSPEGYDAYGTYYGVLPGTYGYDDDTGYGYEYGYAGHVYCLGQDKAIPDWHRCLVDQTVSVEQEFDIGSAQALLKFCWDVVQPADMPRTRTIVSSGTVSFQTTGLLNAAGVTTELDGACGIYVPTPTSNFVEADVGGLVLVSGASDSRNNTYWPIDGFVADNAISSYISPIVAAYGDTGVTVKVVGLEWVSRTYVDTGSGWTETLAYTERRAHRHYRNYLAVHLSQFTGTIGLKFELKLEAEI